MIHVCSLARLDETVASTGARHVVSLLGREDNLSRPATITPENHLWLQVHDIDTPRDGYVSPEGEHVERLIAFAQRWDRSRPMVVHCWAGISRSTAAAFVSVCALEPRNDERTVALALRRASPTATPNARIVGLADDILGRRGRMVAAIEAIGRGTFAAEGVPFRLALSGH